MDDNWKRATEIKSLQAAWHLTRSELRSDFFHDYFYQQAFANFLEPQLVELQRILRGGVYSPRPLRAVPVPKGPLSTRPGSVIPLRDRVVLWSIVRTIAPSIYKHLRGSVYSYQLKENPKQGELFKEGDVLNFPFLKKSDIAAELDPFEAWYTLWPDFEQRTRDAIGNGYRFLVVSDIAAYFENINLDILFDHMMSYLQTEPQLCNFIHDIFRTWTTRTHTGTKAQRGIPQGSNVCSFFGNIYLMPIDDAFDTFMKENECVYIRYMDDMRIFCKDALTARRASFLLEDQARALHLNLQTAKTKILEEKASDKQITNFLFDDRLDDLIYIRGQREKKKLTDEATAAKIIVIAKRKPSNPTSTRLYNMSSSANDLSGRALRVWMNMSVSIAEPEHINTLLKHFRANPDQRISKILINTCKVFPRYATLGSNIISFLNSEQNIHAHQESELIRAARYLSQIPDEMWKRTLTHVTKQNSAFLIRIQSLQLLGMRSHNQSILKSIEDRLRNDKDIIVQPYYMSVLGQREGDERKSLVEFFIRHANPHNHEFGVLLRDLNSDIGVVKAWLDHVMGADDRVADWQGLLWFVAGASEPDIRAELHFRLVQRLKKKGGRTILRARLAAMRNRITQTLP